MSAATRTRFVATYLYPGSLFPEETSRSLPAPTFAAAVALGPDADEGWFRKDGWYAVKVSAVTEKRFTAGDGDSTWVTQSSEVVGNWIIGERIHYSEIAEDTDAGPGRNSILISNIKGNSKDGYGVLTRCGNWQIASDYIEVVAPAEAAS